MNDKVKYWIEISDYDLGTAQAMLESKRYLYVGFMCHQSIEKILKAYYVFLKNEQPPYIHKLGKLAKYSELFDQLTEEQRDFLNQLEPFNIEARYPTYKDSLYRKLDFSKSEYILNKSKKLQEWIKKKLEI